MTIALLRYAYTWHKTKSIVHTSKCLVLLATVTAMAEPTPTRVALYTAISLAYILTHMVLSTIVINCICVGEYVDYYMDICRSDGASASPKTTREINRRTWAQGVWHLCLNTWNSCFSENGYGASSMESIKPLIVLEERNLYSFVDNPMLAVHERQSHRVIAQTEIIHTAMCCLYIAWSQYYVGPMSPAWLWGLVRSGMAPMDSGRESQVRVHGLEVIVQLVSLVTLWVAGRSFSSMITSVVCLLPSHVLGERLFEYINERVQTGLTMREFERSDKFKSKLLAQISHELRSPLLSVITATEMSMLGDADPDRNENYSIILQCSKQLLSMINDILEFGELEKGVIRVDSEEADVRHVLESVTFPKRCKLRVSDNIPKQIEVDKVKLHQVCRNIVNNAIKFTEKGDVLVELDVLTASELAKQYALDRGKYDSCFHPFAMKGMSLYDLAPLAAIGIHPTHTDKLMWPCTPMLIRNQAWRRRAGILLPELSDTTQEQIFSQESTLNESNPELLVMSATDQGIGITKEDLIKIFSAFAQVDDSITRNHEGAGLGLSIVRELVDLMGGFLLVFSTPGKGSKFTVVLPRHQNSRRRTTDRAKRREKPHPTVDIFDVETKPSDKPKHAAVLMPNKPIITRSRHLKDYAQMRCLVVDDQALNRKVLGRLLIQLGFKKDMIEYARDGQEACQLFYDRFQQGQAYHLCLLDMMMPRMDGFTMLEHVRRYERRHGAGDMHCLVLMVSANIIDIEKSLSHGADSYLPKPFNMKTFARKLDELVGQDDRMLTSA